MWHGCPSLPYIAGMKSEQTNNAEDRILLSVAHYDEVVRYNSTNSVGTIIEDMGLMKAKLLRLWQMPVDTNKLRGLSEGHKLWLVSHSGEITKVPSPWLLVDLLDRVGHSGHYKGWTIVEDSEPRYYVTEHGQGKNKHYAVRDGQQHRVVASYIVTEGYANYLRDHCELYPHNFEEEE